MTETQYDKELKRLKGSLTKARNKVKTLLPLQEKLAQLKVVREAEEALFQHKLNRFELVTQ